MTKCLLLLGLLAGIACQAATTVITLSPGQTIATPAAITPPCGTAPGTYPITFTATNTNDATKTASVTVNVTVVALGVSITSPANKTTVSPGSTIPLQAATVSQPKTGVDFYVNNALYRNVPVAPYTTPWTVPNKKGNYTIKAVATGYCGNTASYSVTVAAR